MSCGALQKLQRRSRYEKRTKVVFCTSPKKGLQNRSSRFEPQISLISFSRGSGPPLKPPLIFYHPSAYCIRLFAGVCGVHKWNSRRDAATVGVSIVTHVFASLYIGVWVWIWNLDFGVGVGDMCQVCPLKCIKQ